MPLEHSPSSRRDARRVWYRPAREPLPPEPGRLVVSALLGRARRERGCVTPGDDRLETRAYAVKRYLFRLGHAARSARFACSIEQLVVGLAPVMGWGTVPSERPDRARFVRAHRKSVQRWLDDLQLAGVVAHKPERDRARRWWRTQIVLLAAPDPAPEELATAANRAGAWRARERARRSRAGRGCRLAAIRRRARTPSRATQARLARAWTRRRHEGRRQANVEATIKRGAERAALLTHPFGAPPSSAGLPARLRGERYGRGVAFSGSAASRSAPTLQITQPLAAGTGARAKSASSPGLDGGQAEQNCGSEETGSDALAALEAALCRVIVREAALEQRARLLRSHTARRTQEVLAWPVGHPCPVGRMAEAWTVHRYRTAAGGASAGGARSAALCGRLRHAVELYEAFSVERPPGWPASGPAALCALASQQRAASLAGDVARLLILAKGMRAATRLEDRERTARAAKRAQARTDVPDQRISYRRAAASLETTEQRRRRVRDAVLLSGGDPAAWPNADLALDHLPQLRGISAALIVGPAGCPELDGVGARAARYRHELKTGRWALPAGRERSIPQPTGGHKR